MPLNEGKIISIILDQAKEIDERCDGYRDEIVQVIADILEYERQNRVQATSVQKNINDKCNAAAGFLQKNRGHGSTGDTDT